jgi:hypothetical protein
MSNENENEAEAAAKNPALLVGTIIALIVIAVILGTAIALMQGLNIKPELVWLSSIVVVAGALIAIMGALLAFTTGFSGLNLENKGEALGLPQGSVRALIAFTLIAVFVTTSFYAFRLSSGAEVAISGQTLAQIEASNKFVKIKDSGNGTYDVTIATEASKEAVDIAKQIVTMIGTLVTAVSAFYFGSSRPTEKQSG